MITGCNERWPVIIFRKVLPKIKAAFKSRKTRKSEIVLQKCKQLYANKREIVDGIAINVTAWSFKNYIFKLTKCENAEFFSETSLRSFLRNSLEDSVDGVVAYSRKRDEVKVKYLLLNSKDKLSEAYALLAVATEVLSACENGKKILFYFNDKKALVRKNGDYLVLPKEEWDFLVF